MRLQHKVAVITGGTAGIGQAIAFAFAAEGADLVIPSRKLGSAEEVATRLRATGRRALALQVDVAKASEVREMVAATVRGLGRLDILVNCAGVRHIAPIVDTSEQQWNDTLAVNLTGTFLCCKHAVPEMLRQGGGRVINISSVVAELASPERGAYNATKAAVIALTKTLAIELAERNVTVNAIGPGFVHTSMTDPYRDDPRMMDWVRNTTPLGRWAEPEELAPVAVFLASDEARYVTGTCIFVDGGYLAGKFPQRKG